MKVVSLLLALVFLSAASGKDKSPPLVIEEKIVVLEPLKIKETPLISFAFDIAIYADPKTKKVNRIFIERVLENSDADKAGLKPGDEIIKLDGVAVKEMETRVAPDSPLGRIFLDRKPGETLSLEVITRRTEKFTLRAQPGNPWVIN